MLNQETKEKFEGLGFDVSKLIGVIKSEEEESLDVPNLITEDKFKGMLTEEDKEAFGRNRFEEGKKAMSEIKAKELKEKYNIEVEGKDLDKVIEVYAESKLKEAGKGNAEWLEEKKKLQRLLEETDGKLSEKEQEFKRELFNIKVRNEIISSIPDEVTAPKEDIADLFLLRHRVADEDGRTVYFKGDQKLTDKKLDPLGTKDVLSSFLDERKYVPNGGMGGDGNKGGGSPTKFKSMTEFQEWCKSQEGELSNPMSEVAQKVLAEKRDKEIPFDQFVKA